MPLLEDIPKEKTLSEEYDESLSGVFGTGNAAPPEDSEYVESMRDVVRMSPNLQQPLSASDEIQLQIDQIKSGVTQKEIESLRAEREYNLGAMRSFFWGKDSDEELARVIAEQKWSSERGGTGVFSPSREERGGVGPASAVALHSLLRLTNVPLRTLGSPIIERSKAFQEELGAIPVTTGSALAGVVASEAITLLPSLFIPGAAGVRISSGIFAVKGLTSAEETYKETGNIASAVGVGFIEFISERIGTSALGRGVERTAGQLGSMVMRSNYRGAAKIATGMLVGTGIEVAEEEAALIGSELVRWATGAQSWADTRKRVTESFAFTGGAAGLVGAVLVPAGLASPRARRAFRAAVDTRDQAGVRKAMLEMGFDQQFTDQVVEQIDTTPVGIAQAVEQVVTPNQPVELSQAIVDATAQDLQEASAVLGEIIEQPVTPQEAEPHVGVEPGKELLSPEERASAILIRQQIDERIALINRGNEVAQQEAAQEQATPQANEVLRSLGLQATRGKSPSEKVRILKHALKYAQRVAERESVEKQELARKELRDQAVKFREAMRASRAEIGRIKREVKDQKQAARFEKRLLRARRESMRRAIRAMPQAVQQRLIGDLARVETTDQLIKGIVKAEAVTREYEIQLRRAHALERAKSLYKSVDPKTLPEPHRSEVEKIQAAFIDKVLSKKKLAKLMARRDEVAASGIRISEKERKELDQLKKKPLEELTTEQLEELAGRLALAQVTGKIVERISIGIKTFKAKDVAKSLAFELSVSLRARGVIATTQSAGRLTAGNIIKSGYDPVINLVMPALARMVGGGELSTAYQLIHQNMVAGREEWVRGIRADREELAAFMRHVGIDPEGSEAMNMSAALGGENNWLARMFTGKDIKSKIEDVRLESGQVMKMTRGEIMGAVLRWKDSHMYDRTALGKAEVTVDRYKVGDNYRVTPKDVDRFESRLTTMEAAIVQWVLDRINGPLKRAYAAFSIRAYNEDRSRGGVHVPIKRRRAGTRPPEEDDSLTADNWIERSVDSVGVNQERTEDAVSPFVIEDIFQLFVNYSHQVHGLTNMHEPIAAIRAVFGMSEVSAAFENSKDGGRVRGMFQSYMDSVARMVLGATQAGGISQRGIGSFITRMQASVLGFHPGIILGQLAAIIPASRYVPMHHLLSALPSALDRSVDDRMFADDPLIWDRSVSTGAGLISLGGHPLKGIPGLRAGKDVVFGAIRYTDHLIIRAIRVAVERWADSRGLKGGDRAVFIKKMTRQAVMETQATADPFYSSGVGIEARISPALRLLVLFRSQVQKDYSYLLESASGVRTLGLAGIPAFLRAFARVIGGIILYNIIRQLWDILIRGPEDMEEELKRLAQRTTYLVAGLPLFYGDVLGPAVSKILFPDRFVFDTTQPFHQAIGDATSGIWRLGQSLVEGRWDDRTWDAMLDAGRGFGILTGLPVNGLINEIRKIQKRIEPPSGGGRRPRTKRPGERL